MQAPRTTATALLALAVLAHIAGATPPEPRTRVTVPAAAAEEAASTTAPVHALLQPYGLGQISDAGSGWEQAPTRTALAVTPGSGPATQRLTLTASVGRARSGGHRWRGAGLVVFRDGGRVIGRRTIRPRQRGHTVLLRYLAPGIHSLTARFRPARGSRWAASQSSAVLVSLDPVPGCRWRRNHPTPHAQSTCRSFAGVQVRVRNGPLVLSTSWLGTVVFVVPRRPRAGPVVLAPSRPRVRRLTATVTDLRAGRPGWDLSVAAVRLRGPEGSLPAAALSVRRVHLRRYAGNTLGSSQSPVRVQSLAALTRRPQTLAAATRRHSRGTVTIVGRLRLSVPAGTPPGRYTARLSLVVT